MKIWIFGIEMILRKKKNDQKIAFLAKRLLAELRSQGYKLNSVPGMSGVDINVFHPHNRMQVENAIQHWEINCGTCSIKEEES